MSRPLALTALAALTCLVGAVPLSSASFSATSQSHGSVRSSIDWTPPTVTLSDPGLHLGGTVVLEADASDGETEIAAVALQVGGAGSGQWSDVCNVTTAPYSCELDTSSLAEGRYDLQAVATDGEANQATSEVVAARIVDRTPPTVALEALPRLRGNVTLTAAATDGLSGIATVAIQVMGSNGAWTNVCTSTSSASPYDCAWDSTTVSNGSHTFRAVATDRASNTAPSSSRTGTVDNAQASVVVQDPGTNLSGTVTVAVNATPPAGTTVSSVRLQRAPSGTTTWTDICTDVTAPYTCDWGTTAVTDGLYDLRAIMLDSSGASMTSAVVGQRRVDNTAPRGVGVQAVNGTGTSGQVDDGDVLTFTYSEAIQLSSILAGWTGAEQDVAVRLQDGRLVGRGGGQDAIDVVTTTDLTGAAPVHLGQLDLKGDFIKNDKVLTFQARMVAAVSPHGGTVVTLTLRGAPVGGNGLVSTSTTTAAVQWTPSSSATDLAGNPVLPTAAPDTGSTADRDF